MLLGCWSHGSHGAAWRRGKALDEGSGRGGALCVTLDRSHPLCAPWLYSQRSEGVDHQLGTSGIQGSSLVPGDQGWGREAESVHFAPPAGSPHRTQQQRGLEPSGSNPVFPSWPVRQPQLAAGRGLIDGPITLDPELVRSLRSQGGTGGAGSSQAGKKGEHSF